MYENQGRKIIEAPDLFNNVDLNDNTDAEISKAPLDPQISPKCQNDTLDDTLELSEEDKASLSTEQTQTSKKCPQCGNEMPAKAKFCNRCGHAFAKDEKVNADNSTVRANNNKNVSQKQNETKSQKQVHDVVVQEPVATTKLESEKQSNPLHAIRTPQK